MGPYSSRLATAEGPAQGGPLRGPKESREQPLDVGNTGPAVMENLWGYVWQWTSFD